MRVAVLLFVSLGLHAGQSGARQATDDEIAARFQEAQRAFHSGLHDRAAAAYKDLLRLRPGLVEARVNLALVYFTVGDYEHTAGEMTRVLESQPALPAANLFLGLSLVKLGFPAKAVLPLRRALDANPSNPEARAALAWCYKETRNYRGAAEEYRRLFAQERDPETGLYMLGHSYLELSRQLTEEMMRLHRATAWAHRLKADLFAERAIWKEAEQEYRKALAIEPAQVGLQAALTGVLRMAAQPAIETAASGCAERDDQACAALLRSKRRLVAAEWVRLGRTLLRLNDVQGASEAFAAALAQKPDGIESLYWLIRAYARLADAAFANLASAFPESARTHELRAEIHRLRGAYPESIEEYRAAARRRPDDAGLFRALGELYLQTGSPDQAREVLEIAQRLNPGNAHVQFLLGRVFLARDDFEKAIPYLENAVREGPELLEVHAALGRAYFRTGKHALAVRELKKAAPLDHYGDLHYLLYQCYSALGREDLASAALAQSRSLRKSAFAGDQAKLAEVAEGEPVTDR